MSGYAAVNEAFRLASKQPDLLREAIRQTKEKNEKKKEDEEAAAKS